MAKLAADGTLSYLTYLGGDCADLGNGIGVTRGGNAVIAGQTCSNDFPLLPAPAPPFSLPEGWAGFVTELNTTGTALVYSTYISGHPTKFTSAVTTANSVAVDSANGAYVAIGTTSGAFPTKDNSLPAGAFGVKVSPAGAVQWVVSIASGSGNAGVSMPDTANSVAVDSSSNSYFVGNTVSGAATSPSAFQIAPGGQQEAFIIKLTPVGTVSYASYIGGSGNDQALSVAVDGNGMAYVTGSTTSPDFKVVNPVTNSGTGLPITALSGQQDAFITKISPDGTALMLSGYMGGSGTDGGNGVAVNGSVTPPDMFVVGSAGSSDFPTTTGAVQQTFGGSGDAFVAMIKGSSLPAVTVSPAKLDFGEQKLSLASAPQTVTITNTGTSPVTISSLSTTGDFAAYTALAANPLADCFSAPLVAGASCSVNVTFTPTEQGLRTGTVTVVDDAMGSPQVITVSGQGTAPFALLTPTSLSFGDQALNTTSAPLTVALKNTGSAPLNITGIATTGDFAATENCGMQLDPNVQCAIQVTFTPTGANTRSGVLTVTDDSATSPHSVSLVGNSVSATFQLDPASLTFASQKVSTTSSAQTVTLTNNSSYALALGTITATGDFKETNNCASTLSPSTSCSIQVTFAPTTTGARTGNLTVTAAASNSPQVVSLSGTATEAPPAASDFTITSSSSTVTVSSTGGTATFNVTMGALGGFNNSVALTCDSPSPATCSINPASVQVSTTNNVNATVTVTVPAKTSGGGGGGQWGSNQMSPRRPWQTVLPFCVVGLAVIGVRRKRFWIGGGILVLLLGLALSGCGGGSSTSSSSVSMQPGTYQVTVKATYAGSGGAAGVVHTTVVSLKVS